MKSKEGSCINYVDHEWELVEQIPPVPAKSDDEIQEFYCKRCTKRIKRTKNEM